mmetsp:Transcript_24907/g.56220  ORF Transcript_24907/g.56220 Transcript_24907/m.56220 type:complete len:297 (+) Transcript_24907:205-1095(+)
MGQHLSRVAHHLPANPGAGALLLELPRLIQERVRVELARKGSRPAGKFHDDGDNYPWVLRDEEGGTIARELSRLEPSHNRHRHHLRQHSSEPWKLRGEVGDEIGDCDPEPVLALEMSQLVGNNSLQLLGRHQLDQRAVDNNERLLPLHRHGVGVGDRILLHVHVDGDVEREDSLRFHQAVVDLGQLVGPNSDAAGEVVEEERLLEHPSHALPDQHLQGEQSAQGLRRLSVVRVTKLRGVQPAPSQLSTVSLGKALAHRLGSILVHGFRRFLTPDGFRGDNCMSMCRSCARHHVRSD